MIAKILGHSALKGDLYFSGDKSIAHRAVILGSMAKGNYYIKNFPQNLDCLSSLNAMKSLGVSYEFKGDYLYINSPGYLSFNKEAKIDAGNSGTTARLISGLISGLNIEAIIDGDASLKKRPMKRITGPLRNMGAVIENDSIPLNFKSHNKLNGINYEMEVPSAQVKSCLLLAGFFSKDETNITEKLKSRDHTEIMMKYMGFNISFEGNKVSIHSSNILRKDFTLPGDISSASFFIIMSLLIKNSKIKICNVLLNETRIEFLKELIKSGAEIDVKRKGLLQGEVYGDVISSFSKLKPFNILEKDVPKLIDEIPAICAAASFTYGISVIRGVKELKYKESDRIKGIINMLASFEVKAEYDEKNDLLRIYGNNKTLNKNIVIDPNLDHRMALSSLILSLKNEGITTIKDFECTKVSIPDIKSFLPKFMKIEFL